MTILEYTSASRIGGAETYLLRLIEVLKARGHRVLVVARKNSPIEKELKRRGIEVFGIHRGGKSPLPLFKLWNLVRRQKVDVIHSHLFSAHSRASWVGRKRSVPTVAHIHALGEPVEHLKNSDKMVAVADRLRAEVVDQGISAEAVSVIPTGVNTADWASLPDPIEARERLGLPRVCRPVAVVASLSERKGHRFLIRALKTLIDAEKPGDAPIYALFAGEGSEELPLRVLKDELHIAERIKFLGFCAKEQVMGVLAASDVVALPSLREGLSISVMEAMAACRPVIATDIAGMPELIENEVSGLLVPPGDVEALTTALKRLLEDSDLRDSMAAAGRKRVKTHFEDGECFERMADFLESTAKGPVKDL